MGLVYLPTFSSFWKKLPYMDPMNPVKMFKWNMAIPSLPNKKTRGTEMSTSKSWEVDGGKMGSITPYKVGRLPNDTWSDHPYVTWSDPYQWALAVIHAVIRVINVITPVTQSFLAIYSYNPIYNWCPHCKIQTKT